MKNRFVTLLIVVIIISTAFSSVKLTSFAADVSDNTEATATEDLEMETADTISTNMASTDAESETSDSEITSDHEIISEQERSDDAGEADTQAALPEDSIAGQTAAAVEAAEEREDTDTAETDRDEVVNIPNGWNEEGTSYYENGTAVIGFKEIDGSWYYFDESGNIEKSRWIGNYYVDENGVMAKNRWVGNYYVGSDGKWIPDRWVQNSTGWWYRYGDGSYPKKTWLKLGGSWYYFAGTGYMVTGWQKIDGRWYYFSGSGAMQTGWQKIRGKWYYLNRSGAMQTGWVRSNGSWYYLKSDGAMAAGEWVDGTRYYVDSSGKWTKSLAAGTVEAYITTSSTAKKTSQIILVNGHNISLWNKRAGLWEKTLDSYCGYGKNGLKAASKRQAGDKTTPIGSFVISFAFGTASNPGTSMKYRKVTSNSYWSAEKTTYNTWVESSKKISGEHLIDYYQYKYAMAIGFNQNPVVYGRGSAIFLHCKSKNSWNTAGCVSVYESTMVSLLKSCKNGTYIIIVPKKEDIANY